MSDLYDDEEIPRIDGQCQRCGEYGQLHILEIEAIAKQYRLCLECMEEGTAYAEWLELIQNCEVSYETVRLLPRADVVYPLLTTPTGSRKRSHCQMF